MDSRFGAVVPVGPWKVPPTDSKTGRLIVRAELPVIKESNTVFNFGKAIDSRI
jgi:hypothetical protein